jgi:uncharacterized membrane protein YqhA
MTEQPGAGEDSSDVLARQGTPSHYPKLAVLAGTSRFGIALAIVGVTIASLAMFLFSMAVLVKAIYHAFVESSYDLSAAQHLAVELIEMTDMFLLGMVLYVVAIGMYQLFIDDQLPVPGWMQVHSLNQLKTQIINVVVVLLVVTFLGDAIIWEDGVEILYFGGAVATVVIAVSVFSWVHAKIDPH